MTSHHPTTAHLKNSLLSVAVVALLAVVSACDDDGGIVDLQPAPDPVAIGVVLGSVDISLTVFPVDLPTVTRTIGLGPAGTPVGFAVRGNTAAVPLGTAPGVAVVDLLTETVTQTVGLPQGSGATGIAFVNDSIAIVANPGLNSVTSINVRSGAAGQTVDVGVYPTAVAIVGDRAFVVNANLVNFAPTGPGTVTVLETGTLAIVATITLTGVNPGSVAAGPDGNLYVVNSGNFSAGDGSVAVIDPLGLTEVADYTGFGDFPSNGTFGPAGIFYTTSFSYGIAAWNPTTQTFVRSPAEAIEPGGTPSSSGVGVYDDGSVYALAPTCSGPSEALRLDATYAVTTTITVGSCPTAIHFTTRTGS
jgi:hypothetical protein